MQVIVAPMRPQVQLSAVLIVAFFCCMNCFSLSARLVSSGVIFMISLFLFDKDSIFFCFTLDFLFVTLASPKLLSFGNEKQNNVFILRFAHFFVTLHALI